MTTHSAMRFAILQFPASNCDQDCVHALRVLGSQAKLVWHKDTSLGEVDAVIVPGGFSYGDALRCGAIARFSPVMQAVSRFADNGGLVLGICNGFQILCEAGLLPGALIRNRDLRFHCEQVFLKTANFETPSLQKSPATAFPSAFPSPTARDATSPMLPRWNDCKHSAKFFGSTVTRRVL